MQIQLAYERYGTLNNPIELNSTTSNAVVRSRWQGWAGVCQRAGLAGHRCHRRSATSAAPTSILVYCITIKRKPYGYDTVETAKYRYITPLIVNIILEY